MKFPPLPSQAIPTADIRNKRLRLHGQGEGSHSFYPTLSEVEPTSEEVSLCEDQMVLLRRVMDYRLEFGKYPTVDPEALEAFADGFSNLSELISELKNLLDKYVNIHKQVKEGKTVKLFPAQFGIYDAVARIWMMLNLI